jgi:hypothetical protein
MMSDPQALAQKVGETMFAVDVASKDTMGMELLACEPGRAAMRMTVKALHLNGHQICHGGFIFTLADSTFAFACNSYNKNAVAAGAGASMVMACDIAIAAPGASFIQAFSKIGLIPDAGGSWLLVERLGLARAMALAMTGDKLTAEKAKEWGMIWDVAEDPLASALALAERLAQMPTKALVATRALLQSATTRSLSEHLDTERDTQSALGRTHDYFEGVQAFLEKRTPQFKGE